MTVKISENVSHVKTILESLPSIEHMAIDCGYILRMPAEYKMIMFMNNASISA
jgi:hypothetical protein